ncbi:MAG: hypothetical protein N4J56_002441 [Chroococcidiopsis sp. SAG 2025]|nr:hypothetical protein [Chroococcidiopsis sp. SAG 2025]
MAVKRQDVKLSQNQTFTNNVARDNSDGVTWKAVTSCQLSVISDQLSVIFDFYLLTFDLAYVSAA